MTPDTHSVQIVMPSPMITGEAQIHILNAKRCTLYLRPSSMADHVGTILRDTPHVQVITVPDLEDFMQESESVPFTYPESWEAGQHDPWLVFHTSGTTGWSSWLCSIMKLLSSCPCCIGNPKPITMTQRMMAASDRAVVAAGADPGIGDHFALRRWYTPLPSLHVSASTPNIPDTYSLTAISW
jgi:hypothetical protein